MKTKDFLCVGLLLLPWPGTGGAWAQVFRRVLSVDELVPGVRCLLAGHDEECPDSVYVVGPQEKTGLSVRSREGIRMRPDAAGRIQVEDGEAAVFELVRSGNYYAFRDTGLDAWLAYSTASINSASSASLYTLTDEELEDAPATASQKWYKTFILTDGKTMVQTQAKIKVSSSKQMQFGLQKGERTTAFKLYWLDNYGDSLFIYKEVEEPGVEKRAGGDWTFKGDWLADSLYRLDYTPSRRIDFTGVALPQSTGMAGEGRMPKDFVWTYVRKGEAGRLPEGWPNIIEVELAGGAVPGRAVTRITGCDSCTLGAKYAFVAPEGMGIAWYRELAGDAGWQTVGLPYAVKAVRWEDVEGEDIVSERRAFKDFADNGAVFRPMDADEAWTASVPCLWRALAPRASVACFYGENTVVEAQTEGLPAKDGFYAMPVRYDLADGQADVFLLDFTGTHFVRAAAGSWIAPARGYLVYTGEAAKAVRLVEKGKADGVEAATAGGDGRLLPVYGLDGTRKGWLAPGGHIPEEWPAGLYLTPWGKVLQR